MSVLFVCTGNICRSPTAEGIFRALLLQNSLEGKVRTDSAGTSGYHAGEPPDPRATAHARRRGYDISGLRARKLVREDFAAFDLVLAMDRGHLRVMETMCEPQYRGRLKLFLDFAGVPEADVPDPYDGGDRGFEEVLDMVEAAARGLLDHVKAHLSRVST